MLWNISWWSKSIWCNRERWECSWIGFMSGPVHFWHGFDSLVLQGIFLPKSAFNASPFVVFVQPPTPWCGKDFFPKVSFQWKPFYGVCTALMCNCMHLHVCACSKSEAWAAIPLFGYTKIQHILVQPTKIECACPSSRGIKKKQTRPKKQALFVEKFVYYTTSVKRGMQKQGKWRVGGTE